jgi:hypothetical protein
VLGHIWITVPLSSYAESSVFLFSEPGYYHEGHFGVRLENILEVVKKKTKVRQ